MRVDGCADPYLCPSLHICESAKIFICNRREPRSVYFLLIIMRSGWFVLIVSLAKWVVQGLEPPCDTIECHLPVPSKVLLTTLPLF